MESNRPKQTRCAAAYLLLNKLIYCSRIVTGKIYNKDLLDTCGVEKSPRITTSKNCSPF